MKNPFKKRDGVAEIERELITLEKRKTDEERQRSETMQALEEAKELRRESLSSEDGDVEKVTATIRRLATEAADHADLLGEIDQQIIDAQARLTSARERESRNAEVTRLNRAADSIDAKAPELKKAAATLARLIRSVGAELADDDGLWPTHSTKRPSERPEGRADLASRREGMAALVAELVAAELPELFDVTYDNRFGYMGILVRLVNPRVQQPDWIGREVPEPPLDTATALQSMFSNRLRQRAATIELGSTRLSENSIARLAGLPVPWPELESVEQAIG
ncbi:hypothetical protein DEM27_15430 [Metarhizobium album]|uniref:Uncharacterized protein n=1 Tax=Metarhizobium album TaxID=2182425 RepID=A0A2U2DQ47_9HYPH|nr:hypothetical protein [Rhizobium album]PWE55446.1 hypothetical protein DEM27_15430 [Rhizobium album]